MSKTVVDLPSATAAVVWLREHAPDVDDASIGLDLADAIEAAQGKRYVVLDVDELDLETIVAKPAEILRKAAEQSPHVSVDRVLRAVADQLDSLTPPRPEEPTGLGAVVKTADGREFVRTNDSDGHFPWSEAGKTYKGNTYHWTEEGGLNGSHAVEVLSPGVGGKKAANA